MDAGNRRKEDSGLIDLDALMRQASSTTAVDESGERPIVQAPKKEETKKKETLIAPPPPPPGPVSGPLPLLLPPPPPLSVSAPTGESTAALVTPVTPRSSPAIATSPPSSSRRFVAAFALLALIGAGVFGLARGRTSSSPAAAPVVVVTPHEPAAAPPRPLENANDDARLAAPSANDLPSVAASAASSTTPSPAPSAAKHGTPAKPADAVVTTTELIPESPQRANDLGRAMHDAVGEGSARVAKTEAAQGSGARTLRPSPGAVIGSLNAVLPAARECLGPDDAIRVGTVTFRSDGNVAKVELTGKRETDDCIRGALSRARVEPFADESFMTRVTVRP